MFDNAYIEKVLGNWNIGEIEAVASSGGKRQDGRGVRVRKIKAANGGVYFLKTGLGVAKLRNAKVLQWIFANKHKLHIETLPDDGSEAEEMGSFFDRRADGYESHMKNIGFDSEAYLRASAPLPQTDKKVRILDLGCGTGLELQYLFERMPDARVTCIDLSEKMLAILAANYRDRAAQLEIIRGSYLTWDYPEAEFDYVISVNTMHHLLPEPKMQLYRMINRTLKPGGMYCESDYMVDEARMEQYLACYQRIIDHGTIFRQNGFYHIDIPFTIAIQKELLLKGGFGNVEVFFENIKLTGSGAVLTARK
jgi:tRNA (cmo5U34)-methyltransferase